MQNLRKLSLFLIAISCLIVSTSFAEQNGLYLTIGGGAQWGLKYSSPPGYSYPIETTSTETTGAGAQAVTKQVKTSIFNPVSHNFKTPKVGGIGFFGVGQYITEKIRAELLFVKPFFAKSDFTVTQTINALNPAFTANYPGSVSSQINSAQIRAYMDVFEICSLCNTYVGVGIGWSQVKAKLSAPGARVVPGFSYSDSKNKNNFTWMVGFGVKFDFLPDIKMALEYNFQDFGHARNPINTISKIDFRGHSVTGRMILDI
jgi:opacity protein-like surface antigen